MKKLFVSILCLGMSFGLFAQNEGGLTPEMLGKIKQSYKATPQDKALRNAVANNKFNLWHSTWTMSINMTLTFQTE